LFPRDPDIYAGALHVCAYEKNIQNAKNLFDEMKQGKEEKEEIDISIISMFFISDISPSSLFFDLVEGIELSESLGYAYIKALCASNELDDAYRFLDVLTENNIAITEVNKSFLQFYSFSYLHILKTWMFRMLMSMIHILFSRKCILP
jgi:hypothetical protein